MQLAAVGDGKERNSSPLKMERGKDSGTSYTTYSPSEHHSIIDYIWIESQENSVDTWAQLKSEN